MDTTTRPFRPTEMKCNNPIGLCCTWDPTRCVTHRMPEWRRRSLEGRRRFDAVTDTTDVPR